MAGAWSRRDRVALRDSRLQPSLRSPSGTTASFVRSTAPPAPLPSTNTASHDSKTRWQDLGEPGTRFLSEDHLYTRDLDIFGPASLFQLLSRARTQLGEEQLARWLSAPASVPTVRQRQESTAELREALDFREALATAGAASRDIDTIALGAWASAPAAPERLWLRTVAIVLAAGIVGGIVWWVRGGPLSPLLLVLILKMIMTRLSRKRVARIVRGVERPLGQLDILADTLSLIERSTLPQPAAGGDSRRDDESRHRPIRGDPPPKKAGRHARLATQRVLRTCCGGRILGAASRVGDRKLAPGIWSESDGMAGGGRRVRSAQLPCCICV